MVLALVMVLSVASIALATGEGSLTVKNSEADVTYKFYKIFDLTGQDTTTPADGTYDAITYTIDSDCLRFSRAPATERSTL